MGEVPPTGVYFCKPVNGESDSIDISAVVTYIKKIPEVAAVWYSSDIQLVQSIQKILNVQKLL